MKITGFAFLILVLFASQKCEAQIQYVVTDLGVNNVAWGINDNMQVVGYNQNNLGYTYAWLWQNGILQNLGTLGGTNSRALAINNAGQIVGWSNTTSTLAYDAFLYSNGTMKDMGSLGGSKCKAYDINNNGQFVGISSTSNPLGFNQAFVYSGGTMQNIAPSRMSSEAWGINDNGCIVGGYYSGGNEHAAIYNGDSWTTLEVPPYTSSVANYINNNLQTVGEASLPGGFKNAILWQNGTMQNLGTLGGVTSEAYAINNSGQIVGHSNTSGGADHAFLYSGGAMKDLNNLIPSSSSWELYSANAINNNGQIVGTGVNHAINIYTHAFLLTPVANCYAYTVQPPAPTPLQRFAEWNGTSWVPVASASVLSGNVHILVHGWGAGLQTFAKDGGEVWQANDPITGANTNQGYADLFKNSAMAIESADPGSTVIAFNWLDMSATSWPTSNPFCFLQANQARAQADNAAKDLVSAIRSACSISANSNAFAGKMQIIGLSHGARVAAVATQDLYNNGQTGSFVVNQLTLGDSPEGINTLVGADNNLDSVLSGIKIGRDSSSTFVDNYYSCFGWAYTDNSAIVNVKLSPAPSADYLTKHMYPLNWYNSATLAKNGFGLAWSPLIGNKYKTLAPNYFQTTGYTLLPGLPSDIVKLNGNQIPIAILGTTGLINVISNGINLTEHSPAYCTSAFTKNDNDYSLEFTYQWANVGDGDQLTLWVDDQMRFVVAGNLSGSNSFTTNIDISDFSAGSHTLSVALNNYGSVNASVNVTNFKLISGPHQLVWSGSAGNTWDANSTANFTGSLTGKFAAGDNVTFDDTGSNTAIAISPSGVGPANATFANSPAKSYKLFGGPITGPTSLILSGGGYVELDNVNSYAGGTLVESGTLCIASASAFPAGTSLTVGAGATFVFNPAAVNSPVSLPVPEPSTFRLLFVAAGFFAAILLIMGKKR